MRASRSRLLSAALLLGLLLGPAPRLRAQDAAPPDQEVEAPADATRPAELHAASPDQELEASADAARPAELDEGAPDRELEAPANAARPGQLDAASPDLELEASADAAQPAARDEGASGSEARPEREPPRTHATRNGPRTDEQLRTELSAIGYSGPWDVPSMLAAYQRAAEPPPPTPTQAAPPARAPPPLPAATSRTLVILIGGWASTLDSANWSLLSHELVSRWGYAPSDLVRFSYREWRATGEGIIVGAPYSRGDTCQPIALMAAYLGSMIRWIRDTQLADSVVLVGHSLGGVLAIETLIRDPGPSLPPTPFVRNVVAINSPFLGLGAGPSTGAVLAGERCQVGEELLARGSQAAAWSAYLSEQVGLALQRGTRVAIYQSRYDGDVPPRRSCICGLAIHSAADYRPQDLPLPVPGANDHNAALYHPVSVGSMAAFIGRPRR